MGSDSQISVGDNLEPEWAIDKILSHSGFKEDSLFEVQWKAGDVTWLPYHQIEHLIALSAYFEAMGIEKIMDLSRGTGKPPFQDPQIFVESLSVEFLSLSYKSSAELLTILPSFAPHDAPKLNPQLRSEEHTSELQSP